MELDLEARRLLELTRAGRTPSVEDKLRVERALSRTLGLAAFSAVAGSASTASAKSAAAVPLKWALGIAVPVLAAAGVAGYLHTRAPEQSANPVAPRAPVVAPVITPPEPPVPTQSPVRAEEPPPPAPEPADPPSVRRAVSGEKSKPKETLAVELDLLHEAQAKWRSRDANGALAILAEHRKRYPRSELRLEREALRVLCLCAAGRTTEAKEVASRTFKNGVKSPLRASVEASCVKP